MVNKIPDDHTGTEPKVQRKNRPLWRRSLRVLLFSLLLLFFLLLTVAVVLRLLYPPDRLRAMANAAAIQHLNRQLRVGEVWIHPLRGLILEDVQLLPYPDSTAGYDLFVFRQLRIKKLALQYSLADILDRKFHLTAVEIIEPEMEIFVDMLDTTAVDLAALVRTDLPLAIDLKSFRMRDCRIKVILADTLTRQEIYIGDLGGTLEEVRLPSGGFLAHDSALQVQLQLRSVNSPLRIGQSDLHTGSSARLQGYMDLEARLAVHSYRDIALALGLGLQDLVLEESDGVHVKATRFPPALGLTLAAHGDGLAGAARLDSLVFALNGKKWLHAEAEADSLYSQARLALRMPYGMIPLAYALDLARQLLPAGALSDFYWIDDQVALRFSGTRITGSPARGWNFEVPLQLTQAGLRMNRDSLRVFGLAAEISLHGVLVPAGLQSAALKGSIVCDSLNLLQAAGEVLTSGSGSLAVDALLNPQMLPERLHTTLQINNLVGMKLLGGCDLRGGASLNDLRGSGELRLTGIDLARFPALQVAGESEAVLTCQIHSLADIQPQLRVITSPLTLRIDEEPLLLSELNFTLAARAETDATFSMLHVDSLRFSLNRMVEGAAAAEIQLKPALSADLDMRRIVVRHDLIWNYIPEALREAFGEAELTGSTTLSGRGHVAMTSGAMQYTLAAQLATLNTSFIASTQFTMVHGLGIEARVNAGSREGFRAALTAGLDSLRTGRTKSVAFHHNRLVLNLSSKDPAALIEADGRLELPDLFTSAAFQSRITDMKKALRVKAKFMLNQSIADTLRLPQGIKLRGDSRLSIQLEADTARAHITAQLATTALSLFMPGNLLVRDMAADIHLDQEVDLLHKRLIGMPQYQIATPSTALMDYLVYRGYYQGRLPGLSHVHINRVEFGGYAVDDIDLELNARQGRLEIPEVTARIYGGNMGGRAEVDLAEGDLRKASFDINAHFANINSDLLLPKMQRHSRQGNINGNLDLHGTGLDLTAGIRLEGQAYITQIGPRVADNLLRSLDPQGKDSSIRTTRLLINQGFKPKLMTFVLRHGYLYPEIIFYQPWYFPMRLSGGKVELARIPLDFFLRASATGSAVR